MSGNLSNEDIQKLLESPLERRRDVTNKIARFYDTGGFTDKQKAIAEEIFRALLKDTEVEIRRTLAEAIKTSDQIPQDVVVALAKDVSEVSIPVLEFSEVLSDEDIIDIIKSTTDESKHISVSKRKLVSEGISDALIDTGNENVVDNLLSNINANVSEKGIGRIIDTFSDKEKLIEAVVSREKLPVHIIEHVTKTVSKELISRLEAKHGISIEKIGDAVSKGGEVAAMKVIGLQTTEQDYYNFCKVMKQMQIDENLMPISALCIGNLNMFEICVARKLKVPVLNIRTVLSDESNKGFKVLYERAKLPTSLYNPSALLIDVLRELQDELNNQGMELSKQNANRIITNLMLRAEEQGYVENLDYIITLIRHHAGLDKGE